MYGKTLTNTIRGGNFLHGFHTFAAGGPFDQIVDALGIEYIRWPGGSLTEEFSTSYLASTLFPPTDDRREGNIWEALAYCHSKGKRLVVVLPSEPFTPALPPYAIDEAAVAAVGNSLTLAMQTYPGVIAAILPGNEYWAEDALPDRWLVMANRWLTMARNRSWPAPVLIQTAPHWRPFSEQNTIRHGIAAANRPFVGGTDQHLYGTDELAFDRPTHFQRMDGGETGLSNALGYTATPIRIMSEWGAGGENVGARAPYALHRMLDQLLRWGIDYLCVWPLGYRHSSSGGGPAQLAGWNWEGKVYLSPAGVWYKTAMDAIIGRARFPAPQALLDAGHHCMAFASPGNKYTLLVAAGPNGVNWPFPPRYAGAKVTVVSWAQNPLISGTETSADGTALGVATVTEGATGLVLAPYQTGIVTT